MTTKPTGPRHAGVHLPPPIIYAIGFLVGYLLQRWHSLRLAATTSGAELLAVVGWTLIWLWAILAGAALFQFVRARTTVIPNRPARALVTHGIYRFTRNPMYLSVTLLYAGLMLLVNSWWPVFLLPIIVVIIDRAVIGREERYLAAAFPEAYAEYRRRVRRWL
jgi:protein-S-isoprenylcysteine O-methyltransferase Ste14